MDLSERDVEIQNANHIKAQIVIMWCQFVYNCRKLTLHSIEKKKSRLKIKVTKKKLFLNGSNRQKLHLMLRRIGIAVLSSQILIFGDISQQLISIRFQFNLAMMRHILCGIKKSSRKRFSTTAAGCRLSLWSCSKPTTMMMMPSDIQLITFISLLSRVFSLITMLFINDIALR